jgi:diguanylate cyclase (GGDEF)-like protein
MLSITDSRTDLFNSRHLYERLDAEIARSARYASSLALMMLDVDDFKRFNDTYGHLAGDGVLRSLADMIRACLRRSDSAFRFGGEEFVVLLPETELEQAGVVAERVRARFERLSHAPIPGTQVRSSVSIGITCRREYETGSDCIRRADQAMYAAKQKGKNCVVAAA